MDDGLGCLGTWSDQHEVCHEPGKVDLWKGKPLWAKVWELHLPGHHLHPRALWRVQEGLRFHREHNFHFINCILSWIRCFSRLLGFSTASCGQSTSGSCIRKQTGSPADFSSQNNRRKNKKRESHHLFYLCFLLRKLIESDRIYQKFHDINNLQNWEKPWFHKFFVDEIYTVFKPNMLPQEIHSRFVTMS